MSENKVCQCKRKWGLNYSLKNGPKQMHIIFDTMYLNCTNVAETIIQNYSYDNGKER